MRKPKPTRIAEIMYEDYLHDIHIRHACYNKIGLILPAVTEDPSKESEIKHVINPVFKDIGPDYMETFFTRTSEDTACAFNDFGVCQDLLGAWDGEPNVKAVICVDYDMREASCVPLEKDLYGTTSISPLLFEEDFRTCCMPICAMAVIYELAEKFPDGLMNVEIAIMSKSTYYDELELRAYLCCAGATVTCYNNVSTPKHLPTIDVVITDCDCFNVICDEETLINAEKINSGKILDDYSTIFHKAALARNVLVCMRKKCPGEPRYYLTNKKYIEADVTPLLIKS